jgi:hypothetical protein
VARHNAAQRLAVDRSAETFGARPSFSRLCQEPSGDHHHDKPSSRAACHDRADGHAARIFHVARAKHAACHRAGQGGSRPRRKTKAKGRTAEGRRTPGHRAGTSGAPRRGTTAASDTAAPGCGTAATADTAASRRGTTAASDAAASPCRGTTAASDTAAAPCRGTTATADTAARRGTARAPDAASSPGGGSTSASHAAATPGCGAAASDAAVHGHTTCAYAAPNGGATHAAARCGSERRAA